MSIADAAVAAVLYWTRDDAIIMVAIAGAESGYRNDAPSSTDVWGMPGEQSWWRQYSCEQVYSWGLWQIFMPAHHSILRVATYSNDPCVWRFYLLDPTNNARTAYQVWFEGKFWQWTQYVNNAYLAFMAAAEAAVDEALGLVPPHPTPLPPPVPPPLQAGAPPITPVPPPPSL